MTVDGIGLGCSLVHCEGIPKSSTRQYSLAVTKAHVLNEAENSVSDSLGALPDESDILFLIKPMPFVNSIEFGMRTSCPSLCMVGPCWLSLYSLDPIVGRGMRREETSGPRTFDLHQPRQGGRHDPFAIAPGTLEELGAMTISRVFRVSP